MKENVTKFYTEKLILLVFYIAADCLNNHKLFKELIIISKSLSLVERIFIHKILLYLFVFANNKIKMTNV